MNDILLTYDLQQDAYQRPKNVKQIMMQNGYSDAFTANNVTYRLPNTTLFRKHYTSEQAKQDLLRVAQTQGVKVERLIATVMSEWAAIPGVPF